MLMIIMSILQDLSAPILGQRSAANGLEGLQFTGKISISEIK